VRGVAYVRLVSGATGKSARLRIYDGGTITEGSAITLNTFWQKIECEAEISTNPSTLEFQINFDLGDSDVYVDGCALFVGRQDRYYETHLKDRVDRAAKQMWNWSYAGALPTGEGNYHLFKENIAEDGFPIPFPCSITKMYVYQGTAPVELAASYILYKNTSSSLVCDLPTGNHAANVSGLVDFNAGDRISVVIFNFGIGNRGADAFISLEVTVS